MARDLISQRVHERVSLAMWQTWLVDTSLPLSQVADLSHSLRNINRSTPSARIKCANDPVTRALVWAGLQLIERQFVSGAGSSVSDEGEVDRDLLRFVSQRAVVAEARRGWPALDVKMTKYRDRWNTHARYLADLIRFAITDQHWSLRVAQDLADDLLKGSDDVAASIHRIAFLDLQDSQQPLYRFQLIAATTVERDPVVQQAVREMYKTITKAWLSVYATALESRGLKLRPGITLETLTHILSALAEGLALRMLSDSDTKIIDEETQTSLLGTAGVALFCSCIDPGDGLTVEELLNLAIGLLTTPGPSRSAIAGTLRALKAVRQRGSRGG